MNRRTRQTAEQRTMTEFAFLVHMNRPCGTSLRKTARDVWKLHPHGYRNFNTFYTSLYINFGHLDPNYINGR